MWRVPITALEPALARVAAAGKTALLLDGTGERVTDMYFMYSEATVIEAKKVAAPCNHPATTLQPPCNHPARPRHALGTRPSAPLQVVTDVRMAGKAVEAVQEDLRQQLVSTK